MSAVCHRLADIILPLYLQHFGLNIRPGAAYTAIRITTPQQCRALLSWRRSITFRKISTTHIFFSNSRSEALAQVAPLREFFLSLGSFVFTSRLAFYFLANIADESVSLLHSVTGCEGVTIYIDGPDDPHAIRLPVFTSSKGPAGSSPKYGFTSLNLSLLSFTKPFLRWTIDALTQARLIRLDLEDLDISTSQSRHLLKNIHIPTLQIIYLPSSVPVAALSLFLQRHRSISCLHISASLNSCLPRVTRAVQVDLPSLTHLSGPASVLLSILDFLRTSCLSTVAICPDTEGLRCQTVRRLLSHPACAGLSNLSIELPRDVCASMLAFDPRDMDTADLRGINSLTLTSGNNGFVFSEAVLVSYTKHFC
jgi:hypothetical protein